LLSYRHAFHAGNHADVLKHYVLMQVLAYTTEKDKPYWYIDTHAGAGKYSLESGYAAQNAEYETGISRLWNTTDLPASLKAYVDLIRQDNPSGKLRLYPGSPSIAQALLRADDRMRLFELHPNDYKLLRQTFAHAGKQVMIAPDDGFVGLKALLPPQTRRAVVLIDPPYEDKQDYERVTTALKAALQRFATGTYIVWYPLLQRPEPARMINALKALDAKSWLNVSLSIQTPAIDGFGMFGSGLFVINPPWTLPGELETVLPYLKEKMGLDSGATFTLESHIP